MFLSLNTGIRDGSYCVYFTNIGIICTKNFANLFLKDCSLFSYRSLSERKHSQMLTDS